MSMVYFHYRQQAASFNKGSQSSEHGSREKQGRMQGFDKEHLVSATKQAKIQVVEISK